jgi:hypothetical protein
MEQLLARKNHPGEADCNTRRSLRRLELAVEAGLLTEVGPDKIRCYVDTDVVRDNAIREARQSYKAWQKTDAARKSVKSHLDFLSQDVLAKEITLVNFLKSEEIIKRAEAEIPLPPYQTVGGGRKDQPQRHVPAWKDYSPIQVADDLSQIVNNLSVLAVEPAPVTPVGATQHAVPEPPNKGVGNTGPVEGDSSSSASS